MAEEIANNVVEHLRGLGIDLPDPPDEIVTRSDVATWVHADDEHGRVTSRDIRIATGNARKSCGNRSLLDVAGVGRTGADGTTKLLLQDFVCSQTRWLFSGGPARIVATPFADRPVFLTSTTTIVNDGTDIEIRVFSWDAGGRRQPDVAFTWRILVPALEQTS